MTPLYSGRYLSYAGVTWYVEYEWDIDYHYFTKVTLEGAEEFDISEILDAGTKQELIGLLEDQLDEDAKEDY